MGRSDVALVEERKQGEASGGKDGGSAEVDKKGRTTTLTEQYKTFQFSMSQHQCSSRIRH